MRFDEEEDWEVELIDWHMRSRLKLLPAQEGFEACNRVYHQH